ncbi:sialidase family protein [uncultured Succiniclasticum sp.]|uniref:exo-alpha-sialidase n=1 Tax=uncultured Succiniclasticum sp. TaxID=1500547 RepID=UPI0025FEF571|nr:sialidase family protein [uncultured Succiniclasticum sp.]
MFKQLICKTLPTPMCHGSCLTALPNGSLLCVWFGGSREGAADTEIYFSVGRPRYTAVKEKKPDSGREHIHDGRVQETLEVSCDWTEPVCITNMPEACWNPVLLVQHEHVLLFFKTGNKIADWKTMVMLSRTDPVYWGHPRPLVPGDATGGRGPVRTKPILLPSGRICAGGSIERGEWQCFCDYSDNYGITWNRTALLGLNLLALNLPEAGEHGQAEPVAVSELPPLSAQSFNGRGVIQPVIWQEMGRLHMYMRSTEGYIYSSVSEDEGKHWTDPQPTELYNNNSGFDVIRVPGGRLFLACNPVRGNWGARTPLALFMGREDGSRWEMFLRLEKGKGEFSYPSLTYAFNGLWVSYTYNRENIAVAFLTWREIAQCRKFRIREHT